MNPSNADTTRGRGSRGMRTLMFAAVAAVGLLLAVPVGHLARTIWRDAPPGGFGTDPRALLEELALVRRRGYAVATGEWDERLSAAAVPVCDARGTVIATVVVWGASSRVTAVSLPNLINAARDAARGISRKLGWSGAAQRRTGIVPVLKEDDDDEREREVGDDELAS